MVQRTSFFSFIFLAQLFLYGFLYLSGPSDPASFSIGKRSNLINENSSSGKSISQALVDQELFRQIKGLGQVFRQNKIWQGYDYLSFGQYLIHITDNGPDRAFLINPKPVPQGAVLLDKKETLGLENVYRYDFLMKDAYNQLFGPNGNQVFTFDYEIAGQKYYLQAYKDDLYDGTDDPSMTVSYSTHELFHRYQDYWKWVPESRQDFDNFPITEELLELQILCQEVLKDLPDPNIGRHQILAMLCKYVAIRDKEMELDPSPNKLIKNHELSQEQMEGSARYIEVMSNRQFFSPKDYAAPFGYSLLEFSPESKEEVRGLVGQSVYYGTGASVIFLLDKLQVPIEYLEKGLTPYDMAARYLKLSPREKEQALFQAKNISIYSEIQSRAKQWAALK